MPMLQLHTVSAFSRFAAFFLWTWFETDQVDQIKPSHQHLFQGNEQFNESKWISLFSMYLYFWWLLCFVQTIFLQNVTGKKSCLFKHDNYSLAYFISVHLLHLDYSSLIMYYTSHIHLPLKYFLYWNSVNCNFCDFTQSKIVDKQTCNSHKTHKYAELILLKWFCSSNTQLSGSCNFRKQSIGVFL